MVRINPTQSFGIQGLLHVRLPQEQNSFFCKTYITLGWSHDTDGEQWGSGTVWHLASMEGESPGADGQDRRLRLGMMCFCPPPSAGTLHKPKENEITSFCISLWQIWIAKARLSIRMQQWISFKFSWVSMCSLSSLFALFLHGTHMKHWLITQLG